MEAVEQSDSPDPPAMAAASRLSRPMAWILPIVGVAALSLIVVWFWALSTDAMIPNQLEPGDRVEVFGSDFTITVPQGWTGKSIRYMQLPRWAGGAALEVSRSGLYQEVSLQDSGRDLSVWVFSDAAELAAIEARVADGSADQMAVAGTVFGAGNWMAWSHESGDSVSIRLIRQPDPESPGMQVLISNWGGDGRDELLSLLEQMIAFTSSDDG